MQANLIRLGQGDRIEPHRNNEVDMLVAVDGPLVTCRSTAADWWDCSWVGRPSYAKVPLGSRKTASVTTSVSATLASEDEGDHGGVGEQVSVDLLAEGGQLLGPVAGGIGFEGEAGALPPTS
jgi:hypothetical protein